MNECAGPREMLPERSEIIGGYRLRSQPNCSDIGEYQPIINCFDQRPEDGSRRDIYSQPANINPFGQPGDTSRL